MSSLLDLHLNEGFDGLERPGRCKNSFGYNIYHVPQAPLGADNNEDRISVLIFEIIVHDMDTMVDGHEFFFPFQESCLAHSFLHYFSSSSQVFA
jgi:hypothetical protein